MPDIFGDPTWAEVFDLVRAKDATILVVKDAVGRSLTGWLLRDRDAALEWSAEWNALIDRYNTARRIFTTRKLDTKPIPLPATPQMAWGAILHALKQQWDPSGEITQAAPTSKGDFQDLYARFVAATNVQPNFSSVPQPTATDAQLKMFQAADVAVRAVQKAPTFGVPFLALALVAAFAFGGSR